MKRNTWFNATSPNLLATSVKPSCDRAYFNCVSSTAIASIAQNAILVLIRLYSHGFEIKSTNMT